MKPTSRLTRNSARPSRTLRRPATAPAAIPSPIVKWAGGKTKLLTELGQRLPKRWGRYFEPFFGGGALFFSLTPQRAIVSDRNDDLMNVYRCIRWNVEAVIEQVMKHRGAHCRDYYYDTRKAWNENAAEQSPAERAATFLYLNKTCYNGLFRVNRSGQFNVPMGNYTAPRICDPDQLRISAWALRHVDLRTGHFADTSAEAGAGDFVFFDPPYDPVSKTANFTSYTNTSFGPEQQRELADHVRELTDRGVQVMVSSSDTPMIRELYRGFKLDQVSAPRAISSKARARTPVGELIITNGYAA